MNIKLKNKFKYRSTVALLAFLSLFSGAVGIIYGVTGFVMLPLTSAFLAALICVEKRRIASVCVSSLLIIGEILIGFLDYFTFTSLSSVLLAAIISVFYLKKMDKSESVTFSTLATALIILISAVVYIISTTNASTLMEAYEHFVSVYNGFKESVIESVMSMTVDSQTSNATITRESLEEVFGAYLNCIVAIVTIIAFTLIGLAHKIFRKLMIVYSEDENYANTWRFTPYAPFAYFYFVLMIGSMFSMDTSSVISVSVLNLYLIFMLVFAYIGYGFTAFWIRTRGKSRLFSHLSVLALTLIFSSIALQILAVIGAIEITQYWKLEKFMDPTKK